MDTVYHQAIRHALRGFYAAKTEHRNATGSVETLRTEVAVHSSRSRVLNALRNCDRAGIAVSDRDRRVVLAAIDQGPAPRRFHDSRTKRSLIECGVTALQIFSEPS